MATNIQIIEQSCGVIDLVEAGAQGPVGLQGPQGERGPQGEQGPRGDIGPQGQQGIQGETGDFGPQGETGQRGLQGIQGDKGDQGPQGNQGIQGASGAPGEPLVAVISDQTETGLGGWFLTRDYHGPAVFNYLRAEVLAGTLSGGILRIQKNGTLVRGGIPFSSPAPTIITDLNMTLAKGDQVTVHRDDGVLVGPWMFAIQVDGRT